MLFWNSVGFSSFYYKVGNGEIIRFRQHLFGDENFMKKELHVKEEAFLRKPIERVSVPYKEGLDDNLVQERIKKGWVNYAVESPEKTNKQIVKDNIFTYFNMIFLVLSILLIIAGSYRSLTFLPIIIANTLVGIIQEIRAKNILSKMKMLNAPYAQVIRNGEKVRIPSGELVIDDIVMLSAGNQICADAEVVHGEIHVNEALLTGESDEIVKTIGNTLMSGSIVTSGECYARLNHIGEDSYISRLTMEAKKIDHKEQSEMIASINKLILFVGIAIIPIGIALFLQSFLYQKTGFSESIVSMVAAVIGMIPEGLYLLATIAMAVSAVRLAQNQVLLHDMKSIETLARVNVLCVDKTGTITKNEMEVCDLINLCEPDFFSEYKLAELISDFVAALDTDNITMRALKDYFISTTDRHCRGKYGFSSVYKYSAVEFSEGNYVLGAPEFVMREQYEKWQSKVEEFSALGKRVLVFGKYKGKLNGKELVSEVIPLAFITLKNPIRENAKQTFRYFAEQDVRIKVISGDNPLTVSQIAKEAGINGSENYIDAATLKSNRQLADALNKYTVFGRVTPDQKRQIVQCLQKKGNTVAMTGDGVNDVLALKDADCSIAFESGSEAASQVAQVVLLDNDFSKMPSVVLEGRRVVNNIQRSAGLFFVKNIFSFLLSILSLVFMFTYPLEPSQISFISMFTIGIPGFFLTFEPDKSRIEGRFLSNVMKKAIPGGVADVFAVGALVFCGQAFHLDRADISTAATLLLSVVGFMVLNKVCQPMNMLRRAVWIGNMLALVFTGIFLNYLFALEAMSLECILLFIMFSFAAESFLRYLGKLVDWCYSIRSKGKRRRRVNKGCSAT